MKLHELFDTPHDAGDDGTFTDEVDNGERQHEQRTDCIDGVKSKHSSGTNLSRARRIAAGARLKSRANNPGQSEDSSGWNADPHQGTHGSTFLFR